MHPSKYLPRISRGLFASKQYGFRIEGNIRVRRGRKTFDEWFGLACVNQEQLRAFGKTLFCSQRRQRIVC
jgi:hypothetical protein